MKTIALLLAIVSGLFFGKTASENILPPTQPAIANPKVKIMFVGDVMLGRTVNSISLERKNFRYPFENVGSRLASADITFGNLESPIVKGCPIITSGFSFCGNPGMTEGLIYSGFDVLTIANNHSHNFGKSGFEETKTRLAESGIKWVGDGNLEIIEKGGTKFGFLGFEWVDKGPTEKDLKLISVSDSKVDMLIVAPHWGWEYKASANSNQRNWARQIVEKGADLVVGSHPHWVQDDEIIEGKRVYYSLGNFVFDQMWSEETKKGLAIELTFEKGEVVGEERLPIYIKNRGQPEWVN